ncbi:MAG: Acetylxylan esterase, partial [Candidatus Ordinivivax streblomastigis]
MKTFVITLLFLTGTCLFAQQPFELPLWSNGASNSNGQVNEKQQSENDKVNNITVYLSSKPNGMAIIMCPGGGYSGLAINHEGHDMAAWFNTQGITYIVLKYRMPN